MAACPADWLWLPTDFPCHRHFFTKFLPSLSNDLTEEPCSEERRREERNEGSRDKVAPASFKKHNTTHSEATASETKPKKKKKKKPSLWWSHLFPGFVFILVFFFIFLWVKALLLYHRVSRLYTAWTRSEWQELLQNLRADVLKASQTLNESTMTSFQVLNVGK